MGLRDHKAQQVLTEQMEPTAHKAHRDLREKLAETQNLNLKLKTNLKSYDYKKQERNS